jgi:hypothetical protein
LALSIPFLDILIPFFALSKPFSAFPGCFRALRQSSAGVFSPFFTPAHRLSAGDLFDGVMDYTGGINNATRKDMQKERRNYVLKLSPKSKSVAEIVELTDLPEEEGNFVIVKTQNLASLQKKGYLCRKNYNEVVSWRSKQHGIMRLDLSKWTV